MAAPENPFRVEATGTSFTGQRRMKRLTAQPILRCPGNRASSPTRQPIVLDLCCGMGGLSLAARQLGAEIAAGVDLEPQALRTFKKNFNNAEAIRGSVGSCSVLEKCRLAAASDSLHGAPLVIVSGPPCQGFSPAGSRRANDKRNKVLLAVARAICALRPMFAIVENVQPVLAGKHGKRLRKFRRHLRAAKYKVHTIILNAKDYGVPQNRERAFFLITRSALKKRVVAKRLIELQQNEGTVRTLLEDLPDAPERADDYDDEAEIKGFANHLAMRHSPAVKRKIAAIEPGKGPMSYRKLDPDKTAKTLFSGHRAPPAHYLYPRSITVREAARLQGFPDTFRVYGSFSNQMLQVTNAVPPPLAGAVLRAVLEVYNIPIVANA
jgi:DNA (cytosine-5)-methyltransferase 1